MAALNGTLNGFGSLESPQNITVGTVNGSQMDLTSIPTRTTTILEMNVRSNNDILRSARPHQKVFDDGDMSKICAIYVGEAQNEILPVDALAAELCENLRDEQGERTSNFQALVDLGLLDERNTCNFGSTTETPTPGGDLLTPKGALFLGINWAEMRTIGHIVNARYKHRKQMAESEESLNNQVGFAALCTQLIQQEQTALVRVFPPHFDYVTALRQIFAQVNTIIKPGTTIPDAFSSVEVACKLGWLPEEWWTNKKTGSNIEQVNPNFLKFLEESRKLFGIHNI